MRWEKRKSKEGKQLPPQRLGEQREDSGLFRASEEPHMAETACPGSSSHATCWCWGRWKPQAPGWSRSEKRAELRSFPPCPRASHGSCPQNLRDGAGKGEGCYAESRSWPHSRGLKNLELRDNRSFSLGFGQRSQGGPPSRQLGLYPLPHHHPCQQRLPATILFAPHSVGQWFGLSSARTGHRHWMALGLHWAVSDGFAHV